MRRAAKVSIPQVPQSEAQEIAESLRQCMEDEYREQEARRPAPARRSWWTRVKETFRRLRS